MKFIKPTIKKDWDSNRRIVTNQYGEKFVLFTPRAKEVYSASKRIYDKKVNKNPLGLKFS